jgi:hypothetical protein
MYGVHGWGSQFTLTSPFCVELPNFDVDVNPLLSSLHVKIVSFEFARYRKADSSISDTCQPSRICLQSLVVSDCPVDCV